VRRRRGDEIEGNPFYWPLLPAKFARRDVIVDELRPAETRPDGGDVNYENNDDVNYENYDVEDYVKDEN